MLNGIGCGMSYLVPLVCVWEWYPEKKGLMTGIILGGYGFSSFIFAFVSTKLVNPNDLKPEIYDAKNKVTYFGDEVADRVPFMIRTLATIWSVLVILAVCLISRKPRSEEQEETAAAAPEMNTLPSCESRELDVSEKSQQPSTGIQ